MADDSGERWITVHGTPVLIKDGQDVGEAIKQRFGQRAPGVAKAWAERATGQHFPKVDRPPKSKPGDIRTGRDGQKLTPNRVWTDVKPKGLADQTWQDHFTGDPNKGGQPTPERKKLHDEIVRAVTAHIPPVPPGEKKVAIMTMGGPASGKGTILKAMGADEHSTKFVNVDPDAVKGMIPEYKDSIKPERTYKKAAFMAHEESSFVAKRIRQEAIDSGKHVVIDGTGTNAEKFLKLHDELKAKGYEVHVHYPHIDMIEGVDRAKDRAEGSGRYVPDAFMYESYRQIDKNVQRIMDHVDTFVAYDALNEHKPFLHKDAGQTRILNPAAHKRFMERKPPSPEPSRSIGEAMNPRGGVGSMLRSAIAKVEKEGSGKT